MASGNFLIGNRLKPEGLNKYVLPALEKAGYSVKDKLQITYSDRILIDNPFLVSIVGEGDLEKEINEILVKLGEVVEKDREKQAKKGKNPIAWGPEFSKFSHHEKKSKGKGTIPVYVGTYKTLGVYDKDETATELFPSLAQGYLLDEIDRTAEHVRKRIRNLLSRKLSEL